MLRILINCPGGWSHGLDSPERGEGRWAQNVARVLGRSGKYEVFACSGGIATWGRGIVEPSVTILSEQDARKRGPYDLHFDASWYDKKVPAAEATHNFHVHFGYEPRLGIHFPDRHYLVYVLKGAGPNYFGEGRGNADRTFYLPTPFNAELLPPDPKRRRVIHTMRGSDAPGRLDRFEALYEAVTRLRRTQEVPFTWIASVGLESPRHPQDHVLGHDGRSWGIPYCELRAATRDCGLNAALDGWSNTLDAMSLGVPSLMWEGGVDNTAHEVAKKHDMMLDPKSGADRLYDVAGRLFGDPQVYVDYTLGMQRVFADHTDLRVLALFEEMVAKVMR